MLMSNALIKSGETSAGLLVGWADNFRFFSSARLFDRLDGRSFRTPEKAAAALQPNAPKNTHDASPT
jgi:hypothetical protein